MALTPVFVNPTSSDQGKMWTYDATSGKVVLRSVDGALDLKRDFGAVGNGGTDDSDAVANAITRANELGGNTLISVPPGVYRLTEQMPEVEVSGVAWRGAGPYSSLFRCEYPGTTFRLGTTGTPTIGHSVEGICIDVLAADRIAGQTAFKVTNAQRVIFNRIMSLGMSTFCDFSTASGETNSQIQFGDAMFGVSPDLGDPLFYANTLGNLSVVQWGSGVYSVEAGGSWTGGVPWTADSSTPSLVTAGTDLIHVDRSCDTLQMYGTNANYFDRGLRLTASDASKSLGNVYLENVVFDYNAEAITLSATAGALLVFRVLNSWLGSGDGRAVGLVRSGSGSMWDVTVDNCDILMSGTENFLIPASIPGVRYTRNRSLGAARVTSSSHGVKIETGALQPVVTDNEWKDPTNTYGAGGVQLADVGISAPADVAFDISRNLVRAVSTGFQIADPSTPGTYRVFDDNQTHDGSAVGYDADVVPTLPTAAAKYRGKRLTLSTGGADDVVYQCKRLAAGTYSWVVIG